MYCIYIFWWSETQFDHAKSNTVQLISTTRAHQDFHEILLSELPIPKRRRKSGRDISLSSSDSPFFRFLWGKWAGSSMVMFGGGIPPSDVPLLDAISRVWTKFKAYVSYWIHWLTAMTNYLFRPVAYGSSSTKMLRVPPVIKFRWSENSKIPRIQFWRSWWNFLNFES